MTMVRSCALHWFVMQLHESPLRGNSRTFSLLRMFANLPHKFRHFLPIAITSRRIQKTYVPPRFVRISMLYYRLASTITTSESLPHAHKNNEARAWSGSQVARLKTNADHISSLGLRKSSEAIRRHSITKCGRWRAVRTMELAMWRSINVLARTEVAQNFNMKYILQIFTSSRHNRQ